MRTLALLTAVVAAAATLATAPANASTNSGKTALQQQVTSLRSGIAWHRSSTWHFQDLAGVSRTPTRYAERRTSSVAFLRWIDQRWTLRQKAARRALARHRAAVPRIAHLALWLCIHRGEGAWNDQGAPYYGGLQMSYGWDGLVADAGDLSPSAQMEAAETGLRQAEHRAARGGESVFTWLEGQWPNSSPPCIARGLA